ALIVLAGLLTSLAQAQTPKTDWVASVILPQAKAVDANRLAAALRDAVTKDERFDGFESDKEIILLRLAGGTALVSLMNSPIPKGELQDVCRFAWYWPDACKAVKDHRAHFLVVLMGTNLDRLGSAILQTKILAALIRESDAVAAYWGVNLQSRDTFLKDSSGISRESVPVTLWVNYRVSKSQSGRFSISTHGLKDFGLMEIEAKDAPLPALQLFDLTVG